MSNRIRICYFILFLLYSNLCKAQPPAMQWGKCYGGSYDEMGNSLIRTTDGGYVLAGYAKSNDGQVTGLHNIPGGGADTTDMWVVKVDDTGGLKWEKTFGGSGFDWAGAVCRNTTAEGGYVVAGYTTSNDGDVSANHGGTDAWVVRIDDSGRIVWQRCLGGSNEDFAYDIKPTSDGGYIVAGTTNSNDGDVSGNHDTGTVFHYADMWVVKLSGSGDIIWQKCLGGTLADQGNSIQQTFDGGYIVAGYTNSPDGDVRGLHDSSYDFWVVKLNDTGKLMWQGVFGGSQTDAARSIIQTRDSGYLLTGETYSDDGDVSGHHGADDDIWVLKISAIGGVMWQKCLGGTGYDIGNSVTESIDGNYLIAGQVSSGDTDVHVFYGAADFLVAKFAPSGDILWQQCLGGSYTDGANSIIATADSGCAVLGSTNSIDDQVTGNHSMLGEYDFWLAKLNKDSIKSRTLVSNIVAKDLKVYPTLSNGLLHIDMPTGFEKAEISLYNSLGQSIQFSSTGILNRTIKVNNVADGTYIIEVVNEGQKYSYSVVINNE